LLGERWEIEVTLTRRDAMGFRLLLGRQALRDRLLVDPGRSFVNGRRIKGSRRVRESSPRG
ncbi:MAG: RimK/LysX family protein, partial [Planctomycetota bacterium]|nr:RimK/LysX family protein [Planctomycetota bacterium]